MLWISYLQKLSWVLADSQTTPLLPSSPLPPRSLSMMFILLLLSRFSLFQLLLKALPSGFCPLCFIKIMLSKATNNTDDDSTLGQGNLGCLGSWVQSNNISNTIKQKVIQEQTTRIKGEKPAQEIPSVSASDQRNAYTNSQSIVANAHYRSNQINAVYSTYMHIRQVHMVISITT